MSVEEISDLVVFKDRYTGKVVDICTVNRVSDSHMSFARRILNMINPFYDNVISYTSLRGKGTYRDTMMARAQYLVFDSYELTDLDLVL